MSTLRTGVIYLQKDKLQFYSPYAGNVMEMKFTPTMIRDLDVINLELVENTIKSFITAGKIPPLNLVIILADNAYFTKDFVQPAVQKTGATSITSEVTKEILQEQAEQFVEHVPFDNVVSKTIPLKNGIKVCATNKDFYESIAVAFEHHGFSLLGIFPALVLGAGFGAQPVLTAAMAGNALTKANTLKAYDMLNQQVYQPLKQETEEVDEVALEKQTIKKASRKQIYLVAAIVVVLVVLVVVMVMQFTAPPPNHSSLNTPPAAPASVAASHETAVIPNTPTVSAANAAASSAAQLRSLAIQIVNTTDTVTTAQTLKEKLKTYDFKSVTTQTQSALGSSSTVVSFTPDTTQSVRDIVLTAVRQVKTNITVQDKPNSVYDITIIVGE